MPVSAYVRWGVGDIHQGENLEAASSVKFDGLKTRCCHVSPFVMCLHAAALHLGSRERDTRVMSIAFDLDEASGSEPEEERCYCCRRRVDEIEVVRLSCHSDVRICFHCLSWLNRERNRKRRKMLRLALPDWLPF
jgi:hypothetical protein